MGQPYPFPLLWVGLCTGNGRVKRARHTIVPKCLPLSLPFSPPRSWLSGKEGRKMTIQWVKTCLELSVKFRDSTEERKTNLSGTYIQEQKFWTSGYRQEGVWGRRGLKVSGRTWSSVLYLAQELREGSERRSIQVERRCE